MKDNEYHMNAAIKLEWRKCLRIMWLILYESVGYDRQGLIDFKEHFWEYLESSQHNNDDVEELLRQFEDETGLHLEEAKLKGNFIQKSMKTVDSICFRIGGVILWGIAGWDKQQTRQFIYRCWDELKDYANVHPRAVQMEKKLRIKVQ